MADFVQKLDLKTGSFLNNNSAAAGGIEIDTGAGSKVALAIAAASSGGATPDATDTVKGKVALNTGATAGDATNAIDALTAAGFTALAGSTNALSAAISAGAGAVATVAGTGAPTVAPSATAPAQFAKNANGEMFKWNGSAWALVADGFFLFGGVFSAVAMSDSVAVVAASVTMPRAGKVLFSTSASMVMTSGSANRVFASLRKNGALQATLFDNSMVANTMNSATNAMTINFSVSAGDVFDITATEYGAAAASLYGGYIYAQYIA